MWRDNMRESEDLLVSLPEAGASRVNRYIIEQSPMHRFLRTCRNKGGTWPAKKRWCRLEHTGIGGKGRKGALLSAYSGVKPLSPSCSWVSLPRGKFKSLCCPM